MSYRMTSEYRSSNGQALILSIAVMFLLALLGAIFVAMVARNLGQAERAGDVIRAQYLAEAGIRYADRQLTMGEDGADWRPDPVLVEPSKKDPDYSWLWPKNPDGSPRPVEERFSRVSYGDGRFLLRLSYNPQPNDRASMYIKIESIGRVGSLNDLYVCRVCGYRSPNPGYHHGRPLVEDPTIATEPQPRLRREMVAYKPIGVTDYLRFITNREKRQTTFALGAPEGYIAVYHGGIRVNGDLVWYGNNEIELRGQASTDSERPTPGETVEIAGRILHERFAKVTVNTLIGGTRTSYSMLPSADPQFITAQGFYRDGYDGPGHDGFPRQIVRLEPPLIDLEDPATGVARYRQLTMNSGRWRNDRGVWYNAGRYGWGAGIYIDNRTDIQAESRSLFGGLSLRADWIKPNNDMTAYWRGSYYIPPGVQIILRPDDLNGDGKPDLILIRTDSDRRGAKRIWLGEDGKPLPGTGQTLIRSYPENGVIFAEGNIRIKGMLPDPEKYPEYAQLTVVSGATIYIEGNILKFRRRASAKGDTRSPVEGDPRNAIALLAADYVCVNTTQFVSLLTDTGPASVGSDARDGRPPFHLIVTPDPGTNFRTEFAFGPADYLFEDDFKPMLFVRDASDEGASYINMWINAGENGGLYNFRAQDAYTVPDYWPFPPAPGPAVPTYVYGLNDVRFGGMSGVGVGTNFEHRFWFLPTSGTSDFQPGRLDVSAGYPNRIEVGLDQVVLAQHNYLLSGFTIQPMDIVIEAIILAQDRSFFVIPGPWFNPNPSDTRENYRKTGTRPPGTLPEFPFYGDPLDIKITISGAVTENQPAPRGDVEAWTAKWGRIPSVYGSSSRPTRHPGDGLTFVYDPLLSNPRNPADGAPIRRKVYVDGLGNRIIGGPLPIAPKLPVCTGLVYFGSPT